MTAKQVLEKCYTPGQCDVPSHPLWLGGVRFKRSGGEQRADNKLPRLSFVGAQRLWTVVLLKLTYVAGAGAPNNHGKFVSAFVADPCGHPAMERLAGRACQRLPRFASALSMRGGLGKVASAVREPEVEANLGQDSVGVGGMQEQAGDSYGELQHEWGEMLAAVQERRVEGASMKVGVMCFVCVREGVEGVLM